MQEHYHVSTDWVEQQYCGISIKWNYQKQVFDLAIPGYIQAALHRFHHNPPPRKNMHRISVNTQIMEHPINSPRQRTHCKKSPQDVSWYYSKSQGHYCFMPKRLIWKYWSLWYQLYPHTLVGQLKQKMQCTSYWINVLLILIQHCGTSQSGSLSKCTVTHRIFCYHKQEADQEDFLTWA